MRLPGAVWYLSAIAFIAGAIAGVIAAPDFRPNAVVDSHRDIRVSTQASRLGNGPARTEKLGDAR